MNEILALVTNGAIVLSAIGVAYLVLAGKGYGGKPGEHPFFSPPHVTDSQRKGRKP